MRKKSIAIVFAVLGATTFFANGSNTNSISSLLETPESASEAAASTANSATLPTSEAGPLYNKVEYPLPAVPDSLRLPRERADYATAHFWDAYSADSPAALDAPCMEQAVANFAAIAQLGSGEHNANAALQLVRKAVKNYEATTLLADVIDRCLNSDASPVYDPELYATFARALATTDGVPSWLKIKYETLARLMGLNAPGSVANDIAITLRDGSRTSLHEEIGRKYTVVILYDPECEHCETIMGRFAAEPMVGKWIEAGIAKVVAVDIRPSENSQSKAASLPAEWRAGIDATGVEDEEKYFVAATPAFYLLDKSGKVLLKDADATDVLEAIWMSRQ